MHYRKMGASVSFSTVDLATVGNNVLEAKLPNSAMTLSTASQVLSAVKPLLTLQQAVRALTVSTRPSLRLRESTLANQIPLNV